MLNCSPLHAPANDGYDSPSKVSTTHMKMTECFPILTVKTHRFEESEAQPYEFMKPPAGVACQKSGQLVSESYKKCGFPCVEILHADIAFLAHSKSCCVVDDAIYCRCRELYSGEV